MRQTFEAKHVFRLNVLSFFLANFVLGLTSAFDRYGDNATYRGMCRNYTPYYSPPQPKLWIPPQKSKRRFDGQNSRRVR